MRINLGQLAIGRIQTTKMIEMEIHHGKIHQRLKRR
jgi:hypothetical protein